MKSERIHHKSCRKLHLLFQNDFSPHSDPGAPADDVKDAAFFLLLRALLLLSSLPVPVHVIPITKHYNN